MDEAGQGRWAAKGAAVKPTGSPREGRLPGGGGGWHGREVEKDGAMAVLCHASVAVGLPLFAIAMVRGTDTFALHHARAACCTFVAMYASLALTFLVSSAFVGLVLLCYVPALAGIWCAASGKPAGRLALGPPGDRLFARMTVCPQDATL